MHVIQAFACSRLIKIMQYFQMLLQGATMSELLPDVMLNYRISVRSCNAMYGMRSSPVAMNE